MISNGGFVESTPQSLVILFEKILIECLLKLDFEEVFDEIRNVSWISMI